MKFIKKPEKCVELAEETGIHIGDGCMVIYPRHGHYDYIYAGHASDDLEYSYYVEKLMKKLYGLIPYRRFFPGQQTLALKYSSKRLIEFKLKLDIPLSPKTNIRIPKWILDNEDFTKSCIRGIFDTDGSLSLQKKYKNLHYYPRLKICSNSQILINQIAQIFKKYNISFSKYNEPIKKRRPSILYNIEIYGKNNFKLFMKYFGSSNHKNILKYQIWKKYGFCPPKITNDQKEKILTEKLDPLSFYDKKDGGY